MTRQQVQTTKTAISAKTPEEARMIVEMFPERFKDPEMWIAKWHQIGEGAVYIPYAPSCCEKSFVTTTENIISLSDITADVSGEVSGDVSAIFGDISAEVHRLAGEDGTFSRYEEYGIYDGEATEDVDVFDYDKTVETLFEFAQFVEAKLKTLTPAPKVEVNWDKVEDEVIDIIADGFNNDTDVIKTTSNNLIAYLKSNLRPSDKLNGVDWEAEIAWITKMRDELCNDKSMMWYMCDNRIKTLQVSSPAPALQELGEEETEEDFDDEQLCRTCSGVGGKHFAGCPDDESPFAQLQRDGYC